MAYPPKIDEETELPIETVPEIEKEPDVAALETEKKETAQEDELDFSDMEKLLDEEKAPEAKGEADKETEDLDLDLDLDISPEAETVTEGLETVGEVQEGEELDLSDLENLLDTETSSQESVEDIVEEPKLEAESEVKGAARMIPSEDDIEELDELDLSDLEEILDLEEPTAEDESVPEDMELELDMESEPELEQAPADEEDDDLETVDLSEIEKMLEMEEAEEKEAPDQKDLEIELDMEETSVEPTSAEDSSAVEVYELDEAEEASEETELAGAAEGEGVKPEFEFEGEVEEEPAEDEITDESYEAVEVTPVKKRRVSRPLVALLILVLLGGGSYGAYVLLDYLNIQIPYVSDYFKPKVSDLKGNLKIDTLDINSRFILNVKAGKLFVITGRAKNGYPDNRNFISVSGKLFAKGKKLVKTQTVFCGNVLSDIELSNMDFDTIQKRLSNRFGDNKSNVQVKPGKELPFMIVFSNLPVNLEEFAIEAAGSTPAPTSG